MTFICNLDGHLTWIKETDEQPAGVGMVCAWGAVHICDIRDEVPEGERDEYAALFAASGLMRDALQAAIDCGMVPTSSATNGGAAKYSQQIHVADQIRAALAAARGETK